MLKERLGKALYLSLLYLAAKLKEEGSDHQEALEIETIWKVLEHPLLKEPFIQEKSTELKLLKERIFFLR